MAGILERIKDIEDEMAKTQRNKATEGHLCRLRAQHAKLSRDLITNATKSSGGGGEGFDVKKGGNASVGFVGFPSVGKSSLLNALTGREIAAAAAYEFTTLTAQSSIITMNGSKVQFLDFPGILENANQGYGRGRQVIASYRNCDLLYIVLDISKPLKHKEILEKELKAVGIRINQKKPDILIKKKEKGGLSITNTVQLTHLDFDLVRTIMHEYRINSAEVAFRCDATADDLIDALEEDQRRYIPAIYVLNKCDLLSVEELELLYRIPDSIPISSNNKWNLDGLLEYTWEKLNLVRVYTKPKGRIPDFEEPVVLRNDRRSVKDFCTNIHKSLVDDFKQAIVYGSSVKHQPQYVGLTHILEDEDVITILKK